MPLDRLNGEAMPPIARAFLPKINPARAVNGRNAAGILYP
jgi:hypothetical protein